jgi:hypothetical protein
MPAIHATAEFAAGADAGYTYIVEYLTQMRNAMASKPRATTIHEKAPYAPPKKLAPSLARVQSYWEGLRRGENNMPFWDDVNLSALPDLSPRLLLVDVFAKPQRFRFNFVGAGVGKLYGETIAGTFADEMEPKRPFEYFASQASATVERGAPSYYARNAGGTARSGKAAPYARLLLPMWGDGHISMLLGAFDFA